jgi:SAM-dependent methyltransferase
MAETGFSPAAERNRQPILEVLQQLLPAQGLALEIASGTGQHVAWFAQHLPGWTWQPSDTHAQGLQSIAARLTQSGLRNVREPQLLDVLQPRWPVPDHVNAAAGPAYDLVYCANMLHIAPWATCAALMQGAARCLKKQGRLVTYGPYFEDGVPTAQGNLDFDQSLRARDPAWGLRRKEDVAQVAQLAGLQLAQRFAMPANNLLLVWTPVT